MIGIIPARKNSERLPNKNMMQINGKSLLEHTIDISLESNYIDMIVVTTDCDIDDLVDKYKIQPVMFRRRQESLCGDNVSTQDVVDDVMERFVGDCYILLQPTSPLRSTSDINKCIEMYQGTGCDSLISVVEHEPHQYKNNGAVYIFNKKIFGSYRVLYVMSKEKSVDIDTLDDFRLAEKMLNNDRK